MTYESPMTVVDWLAVLSFVGVIFGFAVLMAKVAWVLFADPDRDKG